MISIRRVYSGALARDADKIRQVQEIFRANFAELNSYADKIPDMLDKPFRFGYRSILLPDPPLSRDQRFSSRLHRHSPGDQGRRIGQRPL
jgi:hypothetical protein